MGVKQIEKIRRNIPKQEIVHAKEYMYERTWKIQRSISSWLQKECWICWGWVGGGEQVEVGPDLGDTCAH